MNLYPAIVAKMGDWTYYIVKMRMREIASEVDFGYKVHNDITLDEAIQRSLDEKRVNRDITSYLSGRDDRFFSSLVVAAIGGTPKFYPVSITPDTHGMVIADQPNINESFGVLTFSGDQSYYALDGQHRLMAIKKLLDGDIDDSLAKPEDFENEEVSVLMVIRPTGQPEGEWISSYRRLFSSLNRYAKKTDELTNIIMDEDDVFAILTRRIISEHDFFRASGNQKDSVRIDTTRPNLREGSSYFTTLTQLYAMNLALLTNLDREHVGWGSDYGTEKVKNVKQFIRFRPEEEYVDALFEELTLYWDTLIEIIPDLAFDPKLAKNHSSDGSDGSVADNALFWPIGQDVMVKTARALLNENLQGAIPNVESCRNALAPLADVEWRLHYAPWVGILLRKSQKTGKWTMRDESRKTGVEVSERLLRWITGADQLHDDGLGLLKVAWQDALLPPIENQAQLWDDIAKLKERVSG